MWAAALGSSPEKDPSKRFSGANQQALWVHQKAEYASSGLLARVFLRRATDREPAAVRTGSENRPSCQLRAALKAAFIVDQDNKAGPACAPPPEDKVDIVNSGPDGEASDQHPDIARRDQPVGQGLR